MSRADKLARRKHGKVRKYRREVARWSGRQISPIDRDIAEPVFLLEYEITEGPLLGNVVRVDRDQ